MAYFDHNVGDLVVRDSPWTDVRAHGAVAGATDSASALNTALASGANIVDGAALSYSIDSSITVPAGVTLRNITLVATTSGINMVLVNTGSKVLGVTLTGSGTTNTNERGIYPAADGVTDVEIDAEISNLTYGIHAQPTSTVTPERWRIRGYIHDIVGATGVSEGYGILLSPADHFDINVRMKTIARHGVYLSAGASHNNVYADIDGCENYAFQIYSTSAQTASQYNTIRGKAKNLTENVANQSGGIAVTQKAHHNDISIDVEGDNGSRYLAFIEGTSGGPYPLGNKIHDSSATGQFTGTGVITLKNADSTVVTGNSLHAYGSNDVIGSRLTGTNGSTHGGFIEGNVINAQAQNIKGIYVEMSTQPVHVGINDIRNTGTAVRVDDNTSGTGYRTGYSRRAVFSATSASIPATTAANDTGTLQQEITISGRRTYVYLTDSSVSFDNNSNVIRITTPASDATWSVRIYNAEGSAQTFDYEGVVEGD